eukprot:scaffold7878_cov126-Isochrysis_galbana.AAC.13
MPSGEVRLAPAASDSSATSELGPNCDKRHVGLSRDGRADGRDGVGKLETLGDSLEQSRPPVNEWRAAGEVYDDVGPVPGEQCANLACGCRGDAPDGVVASWPAEKLSRSLGTAERDGVERSSPVPEAPVAAPSTAPRAGPTHRRPRGGELRWARRGARRGSLEATRLRNPKTNLTVHSRRRVLAHPHGWKCCRLGGR